MSIATSAARLHAHHGDAPDALAQEVNRCLRLVKVAASRREAPPHPEQPVIPTIVLITGDAS